MAVLGAGDLLGVPQLCAAHMVIGIHRAVGMPAQGAYRLFGTGGRAAGVARGLDGRAALQLHAAALAVGIAGVAVLGTGGLLGVPQLCAALMVVGVHRAVGLLAQGAYRLFGTGGRTALVFSGQLLPRQHRQPFAAAGQPLADTFGIPRMLAASFDQRRQHRAVGKRLGALAGCTISLCVCRSPQEIARLHGAIGDLRTGGSLDRAHIVAVGHRAAVARDAACVLAAGRDRAHVVAVGHRARAAAGDAAHAVDADDRTCIAAGRHTALVIAHDAAGILGRAIPPAKPVNAHNDALVPAVQDGRPGIGMPRDAAHTGPSAHIARHRQVFHRGALQPAEQPGRINRIGIKAITGFSIVAVHAPDGVAAAVKDAGVGPLLAADGIHPTGRLIGSRCVMAIRVKRAAVDHNVVGQHGAQAGTAEPIHLHRKKLQFLLAADPAGLLLRAAARCVAGHRCPVLVGRVALVDHLAVVLTALIEPAQEGTPLLLRPLRHHGEKVLAQHLPRIGLAVRLIRQAVLLPVRRFLLFPFILRPDDGTVDDLYRLILVKAAAADRAAHQRAVASVAGSARTRHLTVERTAGDGAAVRHSTRKRAVADGAVTLHRTLERTALDGAVHLAHHRARKRAAADGALALHSTGKHAVLDAAVALHLFGERGGAGRSLASGDVPLDLHLAVDGAAVCVQDALEIYAHIDLCIAADGKRAPAAEDMLLFALGSFCGDRAAADGRAAAEADAAAVAFFIADRDAVPDDAALHDEHAVVADTAALFAGYAAFDGAAVHDEPAALLPSAVDLHTAAAAVACSIAACDTAVDTGTRIHLEAALIADMHTAAAAAGVGIDNLAAHDAAALHDEGAVLYVYTAAAVGAAAIDNAAVDSLCAARLIQHPQMVCIWLKFVFLRGVAVHHRQLSAFFGFFAADLEHAAAAGHPQHLAVQVEDKLARNDQRAVDVNVRRQLDARLAGGQSCPQSFLRIDISKSCDPPFRRQGQIIRHLCAEVICLPVRCAPAVKSISVFGGVIGLPRHRTFLQKMLGVHRAVRHVRHSDLTGELDAGVDGAVIQHIARLLERAAVNASALVVGHTAGKSGAAAAGDRAVAVHYSAGNRTAVGAQGAARAVHRAAGAGGCAAGINGAGVQLEHTLSAESHSAAPPILGVRCIIRPACRDAAAVHGKAAVLHIHAAAKFPRFSAPADAVTDYAVLHGKAAAILDIHTASAGLLGGAAEDAALVHGKCAPRDNHTAAQAAGGAADDAAPVHGKRGPIDTFSVVTFKKHTAAVTVDAVGAVGGAAHDAAALHGQMSAGVDIYAAAIKVPLTQCSRAAGNDAAGDALFASRIQHPQAVAVRCEPALLRIRPAVGDG